MPTVGRRAYERLSEAAPASLAVSLALVVVAGSYIRLYFTIDFTDEALYTSIPYRFVLGDRPFIDEWNMAQLAGLILYPFVKAFILFSSSSEWIILYTRHVAFFLSALVSMTVFLSLKGHVGRNAALLFSLLPVVFVPYNLLGPGYNALGGGFLTAGLFLAWDPARRAHNDLWTVGAALAHGLAVFSYPTLLAPSLCFLAFLVGTATHKVKTLLLYGVGGLVGPAAIVLAFHVHVQDFLTASNYAFALASATEHDWTPNKLWVLARDLWNACLYKPFLIAVLLVLLVSIKKRMPKVAAFVILGWPMFLFHCTRSGLGGPGTMGFLLYNGLFGLVVFCCIARDKLHWRLLLGVWLPSALAGATVAWSSGMGIGASAIGMVPANVVTLCFAASLLQQTVGKPSAPLLSILPLLPAALVVGLVLNFRRSTYLDDYPKDMHTRVESGPFRGLYTTAAKDRYFSRLSQDIDAVKGSARSILFLPHLPAGYLVTELRPATLTAWGTCPRESTAVCIEYYQKKAAGSSIVVRIKELYYYSYRTDVFRADEQDPMEQLLRARHQLVVSKGAYDIFLSVPAKPEAR